MSQSNDHPQLTRLIDIVARLRAPDGCPWDREQTESTMAPHLLEETCEAVDAIERGDQLDSCEELGDVLMNVLMISQIAAEHRRFSLEDVARGIADKLVRRHPHVFPVDGQKVAADDSATVLRNWEAIKQEEKAEKGDTGLLAGIPPGLPQLLKAHRIGEKAARVGFDWPERQGVRDKVDEELAELDQAIDTGDQEAVASEIGDLLFTVANLARHLGVNPDMALRGCVRRFVDRFARVEQSLGKGLRQATLAELEAAWQAAKESG